MSISEQMDGEMSELLYGIFQPKCFNLLQALDIAGFAQGECLKYTLSKLLGLLIVVLAPLSKLPQIINIVVAGSVEGLNTTAYLMETFGYLVFFVYNYRSGYPFSTYGEVLFIYIQNLVIILLVTVHRGMGVLQSLFAVALIGMLVMAADGIVPMEVLTMIQSTQVLISIMSKVPQIYENFKNGSTGQLSSITVFLFFAGSLARVFTTLQEAPDPILIASVGVAAFFNTVLFAQVIMYTGVKKKVKVCCKSRDAGKKND